MNPGREIITRIALPGGTIQTEPVESAAVAPAPGGRLIAAPANAVEPKAGAGERISLGDKFLPAGAGVVQMKMGLIERKTITHQAMKPQKKSLLEDNLTANQSLEASEQVVNDLRREQPGGVEEEDASRYQSPCAGTRPTALRNGRRSHRFSHVFRAQNPGCIGGACIPLMFSTRTTGDSGPRA